MADKLPYYRWFPKDAETSEAYASMTDAELGFYHRCLNRAWLNDGLPADPAKRAQALQKPRSYADKMWSGIVGERFTLDDNGRYRNGRQEEERMKAIRKSEQASDAVSERERKRNIRSSPDESTDDLRAQARPGSGSVSGSSEEVKATTENKTSTRARGPIEWFEEFWSTYWRRIARSEALKCYKRHILTEEMHGAVMLAVAAQTPVMLARDVSLRPHATTWLNQHRWEDDPEPPPAGQKSRIEQMMDRIV